ncbi:TIGR03915 family putative DNA repair protein [Aegicerativicinus sediminis]|uniref:TIGR03915 family putative DNA repair protein n=1 Tax=Aegicerativicinus sediminis TaxID=2893202 RepID=UPI001E3A81E2|nr:TIGR03915 family putative DNA repair protein [Aegicerativicinus sediminis]
MDTHLLQYDGSFDGFLTAIFEVFEQRLEKVIIQKNSFPQTKLFALPQQVITNETKSTRVWTGLRKKVSTTTISHLYYSFLSELPEMEGLLLDFICRTFRSNKSIACDYSDPVVLRISQISRMVGREKHRMEAFVRFRLTKDGIYFANIEPDFDVLPLISKHFQDRYADQKWLIYDLKRNYGIYYDLLKVDTICLELTDDFDGSKSDSKYFSDKEIDFQTLWKDYFDTTNIASRKNMKLHIRHVPKRYWKYLSEKRPNLPY